MKPTTDSLLDQARQLEAVVFDSAATGAERAQAARAWMDLVSAAGAVAAPGVPHYDQHKFHPRLRAIHDSGLTTDVCSVLLGGHAPAEELARPWTGWRDHRPPAGWTPPEPTTKAGTPAGKKS